MKKNEVKNAENMNVVENHAIVAEMMEQCDRIDNDAMEQFIKDNDEIVPKNQRKKYDAMTLEQKVAKIKFWQDMKQMREQWQENRKLENKVKALFDQRKPSTEDVLKVIEYCKSYINDCKAQEIARLDEEIARLNEMRNLLNED
jgi:hypothetical protein